MDEVDIDLIMTLAQDVRISFRELADHLGLSINAVHKRMRSLEEDGVIGDFRAMPSPKVLCPVVCLFNGVSRANRVREAMSSLGSDPRVHRVILAGGNILYVQAFIREINELQALIGTVRERAEMAEMEIAFFQPPYQDPPELTTLDYRIIRSLDHDSRKAVSEVASDIGVSTRTVRRRLGRMMEEGSISLYMEFSPVASRDIISIMNVRVPDAKSKRELAHRMIRDHKPNVIGVSYFTEPNEMIYTTVWARTMKELMDVQSGIEAETGVRSIFPNIFYHVMEFDTWIDEMVEKRSRK